MKKYTVKAEYADQIFGGECDTAYVEECMRNGMPEEDVMHLVREFGEEVLEQFDIEEEEEDVKRWYAAVMDREDNDWGYGSHDLEEAKKMARKLGKGSLVIVIDDGSDPVAVDDIDPWENLTWKVYACGGDHDGEFVAEFENEALAINYCYDHENDYPLGHSIVDPDGNDVENW